MPRFHVSFDLVAGARLALPPGAARHAQVLRLQPGHAVTLFDGRGGEWGATIARMGRSEVEVTVGTHDGVEREAARAVHLAVGLMAAERMDWLVEKATELGAASLTPVLTARSSLRLSASEAASVPSKQSNAAKPTMTPSRNCETPAMGASVAIGTSVSAAIAVKCSAQMARTRTPPACSARSLYGE